MAGFSKKKITKTLQFLAAYIVAVFTFLEILQWLTKRFSISPHWLDIYLWIFIGIIPSVLIYFHHQDRLNKNILKLREKIIFPLNALIVIIVICLIFGGSDLGSTKEEITYPNALGELESHLITKKEFRTGFPVFNFDFDKNKHGSNWMPNTINRLLWIDLLQDSNLAPWPNFAPSLAEKISKSRPFFDYYVDGEFKQQDSVYTIVTNLRHSKNGKIKDQKTFSGTDYLSLIDDASIFIREALGVLNRQSEDYVDLPIKDIMSSSLYALGEWAQGGRSLAAYERAIESDSSFTLAYLDLATERFSFRQSKEEELYLIDKAHELMGHLPEPMKGLIVNQKYLSHGEWEKAEEHIKLMIKYYGRQRHFDNMLSNIYAHNRDFIAILDHNEKIYALEKNIRSGMEYFEALVLNEKFKKVIQLITELEKKGVNKEDLFKMKAWVYLLEGDILSAEEHLNTVKLLNPEPDSAKLLMTEAIDYQRTHKNKDLDLADFIGKYRYHGTEQHAIYFLKNNKLHSYFEYQILFNYVKSGPNTYINPIGNPKRRIFLRDDTGKVYGFKSQNDPVDHPDFFWYFKVDDYITLADSLLKAKNYQEALPAYKEAITHNPNHYYLKDGLRHLEYISQIDSTTLQNQYKRIVGNYGSTKVTVEENKLFYNYPGHPKFEILPISETEYITLSRYRGKYMFEFIDNDQIATFISEYNPETSSWEKDPKKDTYFLKDD